MSTLGIVINTTDHLIDFFFFFFVKRKHPYPVQMGYWSSLKLKTLFVSITASVQNFWCQCHWPVYFLQGWMAELQGETLAWTSGLFRAAILLCYLNTNLFIIVRCASVYIKTNFGFATCLSFQMKLPVLFNLANQPSDLRSQLKLGSMGTAWNRKY